MRNSRAITNIVAVAVLVAAIAIAGWAYERSRRPEENPLLRVELPTLEFDYNELPDRFDRPGPDGRFSERKMRAALRSVEAFAGYWEIVHEATPMSQDDIEDLWAVMQRRPEEILEAAGFQYPVSPEEWVVACAHFGKLIRTKGLHEGAESGLEALRLGLRAYWKTGKLETDDPRFIPLEPSRNKDGYKSYNPAL